MKVTVCFGAVRVLVPCGAGHLLVRDLVREATFRYNKATGQDRETWMGVRAIRASSGGILDPDDRVCDVADDRETLTAECTSTTPQPRAAQADGASGSSAGTASPDMFRGGSGVGGSMRVPNTDSCVEVSAAELEDGSSGLQVRRGSEPTLNQDTLPQLHQISEQTNKRWSAAVICREDTRIMQKIPSLAEDRPPDPPPVHGPHNFQRHSNRLSMQFSGPGSGVWMDAADRVQSYGSKSLPRDARRDPLGQDTNNMNNNHRVEDMLRWVSGVNNGANGPQERPLHEVNPEQGLEVPIGSNKSQSSVQTIPVTLVKGEKGLGFTITTRDNPTGGDCPIYIKNILPKGAAVADGRLRAGDRLISVCGSPVSGRAQQHVVSLLRATPTHAHVTLLVERRIDSHQNPTKYVEKEIGTPEHVTQHHKPVVVENGRVSTIVNAINSNNAQLKPNASKEFSPDNGIRDQLNTSSSSILSSKNRTILHLDVPVHDSEKAGLGISVKGKVTVGSSPHDLGIFIKSVLHGGAASRDGRLHTNDQLLSVNGVSLMGQSNAEAMETLRRALLHARPHRNISLTIARRTASMDSIARWKDDTPPNENETNSSNETNQNFTTNTVIYNNNETNKMSIQIDNYQPTNQQDDIRNNKRHASVVTIKTENNNSFVSNQSDDSKGFLENNNNNNSKRDSFEWSKLDGWNPVIDRLTGLRNESYYMATQDAHTHTNGHGRAGHIHIPRSPPHHNVIIEEDYVPAGSVGVSAANNAGIVGGVESGSECGAETFTRDAVGRRSMSEKRHAAVDARSTGTYHKIKMMKANQQVGPYLGMRKSSSLESLQTAIQETKKHTHKEPTYARVHPPLKHWLTDDHADGIIRGSPQQSSLSHKKPSLLKSLSTMFSRKGKPQKKPENEIYGRSQPGRSSEKSLSRDMVERQSRHEERHENKHLRSSGHHTRQASSDRTKADERINTPPYRAPPIAAPTKVLDSAWGPSGHYVNYDEIQHNLNVRREKLSEVQIGQMRQQVHAQRAKVEEESRRGAGVGYHSQRSCRDGPPVPHGGGGGGGGSGGSGGGGGSGGRPHSNYYEYDTAPPRRPGKLSHYH